MNKKIDFVKMNTERSEVMIKTLSPINAFVVLCCAITIDRQLVVFGFDNQNKALVKEMLQDYLDSLDNTEYEIREKYKK